MGKAVRWLNIRRLFKNFSTFTTFQHFLKIAPSVLREGALFAAANL
jgi:hypothetical protein